MAFAVAAVLALGGVALERTMSAVGLNPKPASGSTVPPTTYVPVGTQVDASLARFMGVVELTPVRATGFSLVNQLGRPLSLRALRGKVVVLSFFNSSCHDICPVVEDEIAGADAALGSSARNVEFVTVNTDPLATTVTAKSPAVSSMASRRLSNWEMVGGRLSLLNAVWKAYGLTINVSRTTGLVAHNDLVYFIDQSGRLRIKANAYANESTAGVFSLPPASIARWGEGIATYASSLSGAAP